jgi:hypothetical protein
MSGSVLVDAGSWLRSTPIVVTTDADFRIDRHHGGRNAIPCVTPH